MGNGCFPHRNGNHAPFGVLAPLPNGVSHLTGFSESNANASLAIANDQKCAETEPPATLDHLGRAVDKNNLLAQLIAIAPIARSAIGPAAPPPEPAASRTVARLKTRFCLFRHDYCLLILLEI